MEIKAELEKSPSRNSDLGFSLCETCNSDLGRVKMDAPLYCISCIEEMDRLSMTPKRYRKHRELRETFRK